MALFGPAHTRGSALLTVFVLGRVVGATGWLLVMTDHQYPRLFDSWLLAGLNVAARYYLVVHHGLLGAVLGTAGSRAVVNVLRLAQFWYLEGLQPFDVTFGKPIAAGAGMAVVTVGLRPLLSGPTLLAVGTPVGVATFVGLLVALGVERVDRALLGSVYRRYRRSFNMTNY